ncbi:MAG: OmpA family protein [Deltaproteobacteria bacterium]|nr:OmpA family protein [Deltaproteobacteria bacterium]
MQRRKSKHEEGWLLSYADLITNLLLFFVILVSASSMSAAKMQELAKQVTGEEMPESLASIQKEIDERIEERSLQDVVRTEMTAEGLELFLDSGVVFDSGKVVIKKDMEESLASMLEELAPYSKRYHFAVEGHTDSQPVTPNSRFESNWELSTARAIVVRGRLEAAGVDKTKIRVEGYADTLTLPEETLTGLNEKERRARHRRVVVRVF